MDELGTIDAYHGLYSDLDFCDSLGIFIEHGTTLEWVPRQYHMDYTKWRALDTPGAGLNNLNNGNFSCCIGLFMLHGIDAGYYDPSVDAGLMLNILAPNTIAESLKPEDAEEQAHDKLEGVSAFRDDLMVIEGSFNAYDIKNRIVTRYYYINTPFTINCMEINGDVELNELEKLEGLREQFEIVNCESLNYYQLVVINLPPGLDSSYEQHDPDKPC